MTITATTTDESILANVQHAKDRLVAAANAAAEDAHVVGPNLVQMAQAVRNAEAVAHVQIQLRNVLRNEPNRAQDYLLDVVSRGADDSWSGRDNDSRRAAFDAVLSFVQHAAMELRS